MLRLSFRTVEVQKLYPLAISRGTQASSENLFVFVSDGEHTGVGELSPAISSSWTAERGQQQLELFGKRIFDIGEARAMAKVGGARAVVPPSAEDLGPYGSTPIVGGGNPEGKQELAPPISIQAVYAAMRREGIDPPAMAALDMAFWDLLGKQANMPLYKLWGLGGPTVPTSVTIGINPVEVIKERVPEILQRTGAKCLKIKLGCPDGVERDKENYEAARQASMPFHVKLRVDANGGWTVDQAKSMMRWLAERGADYVEQPLPEGQESDLPKLFEGRPLPIFVDESCRFSQDVPKFAHAVDGVNLKLMKCGGPTEAMRIVATARAFGLKTMIGCMSETSVAIAAGAHLGALFDHIDLDSHLNLNPDPAMGAPIQDGVIMPTENPGHGAELKDA